MKRTHANTSLVRYLSLSLLAASVLGVAACGSKTETETKPGVSANVPRSTAQSPSDAYRLLFESVKKKDSEGIKSVLSRRTLDFASDQSGRKGESLDYFIRNGFSAPAKGDAMPEIRDEQIKDGSASIEVYNAAEKRWEMTPFVLEDGGWKLAVGEMFANLWKQPGKTQSQREMEASGAQPKMIPGSNVDFNKIKPKVIDPTRGNVSTGPNPTLDPNVKPVKIPTH